MSNFKTAIEQEVRTRGLTIHTEKSYVRHVRNLLNKIKKPYSEIELPEVIAYQHYIANSLNYSSSYFNQCTAALLFFFKNIACKDWDFSKFIHAKRHKKLPEVLNKSEVLSILQATDNSRDEAILYLLYSVGMRVSDVKYLQVKDIDSKRMVIHIKKGKGQKDRIVPLSKTLLDSLREYWKSCKIKPNRYLFPGNIPGKPLNRRSFNLIVSKAVNGSGINKKAYPHMLRHSFATHALEDGTDIRVIQHILGHASIETTTIYTYVSNRNFKKMINPLDSLLSKKPDGTSHE